MKRVVIKKSRVCSCCNKWVAHDEASRFLSDANHPANLTKLKADKGISPHYRSCQSATSNDGYVFEGHMPMPAHIIPQFLVNPPQNAIGLAVPDIPVGSPSMEVGKHFAPYDGLLSKPGGTSEVYTYIANVQSSLLYAKNSTNGDLL